MSNKRGWLRILEATIAILIVAGILLVMYSRASSGSDNSGYVYSFQKKILDEISFDNDLREKVLNGEEESLESGFVRARIPAGYGFKLRICDIDATCGLTESVEGEIYVQETYVVSNLETYNPKKVKLFVWEQ